MAFLLALVLLYPLIQLLEPAAMPSQRATLASRHGTIQLDNEEGALLYQSMEMGRGNNIYRPLTDYPYVAGTYPPLYMWIVSLFHEDARPDFGPGRIVVWMSTIGIAAVIAIIIALRTRRMAPAAVAALAFLATYEVYQWIAYYRVDLPALYLTLLGLSFIVLAPRYLPARICALLFFVLAVYTKQTTLAAPLAATVALCALDVRRGIAFGAWFVILVSLPFAAYTFLTEGQFAIHTVLYNINTYDVGQLNIWRNHVWFMHKWLLIAAIAGAAGAAVVAFMRGNKRWAFSTDDTEEFGFVRGFLLDPLTLYAVFSCANFVAIGKAGTAENYLLEPLAAFTLFIGHSLGRMSQAMTSRGPWLAPAVLTAAIMAYALVAHAATVSNKQAMQVRFNTSRNPNPLDFAAAGEVRRLVRSERRPTWTELAIFNLQAGRDPVVQPFIMSELARQGRWNQEPFLQDLRDQKFGLIVTQADIIGMERSNIYTDEMISVIRQNYRLDRSIVRGGLWRYHILRPRTAGDQPESVSNQISQAHN